MSHCLRALTCGLAGLDRRYAVLQSSAAPEELHQLVQRRPICLQQVVRVDSCSARGTPLQGATALAMQGECMHRPSECSSAPHRAAWWAPPR